MSRKHRPVKVAPVERPAEPKSIRYDHGDYRAEYDGNLIGYYPSYHAAEVALDDYAYDLIADGLDRSAGELDGGTIDPSGSPDPDPDTGLGSSEDEGDEPPPSFGPHAPHVRAECISCGDPVAPGALFCRACRDAGELDALIGVVTTCPVCTGAHHIQQCPSVLSALYAPLRPDERLQNAQSALLNRIAGTPKALGDAEQAELQALLTPEEEARFVAFRARARAMFVRLGVR